ncbi:MAG: DUF1844 domain-containing protein [Desulfovibrio sp.]|jgi:hypothetical protein|nr:DUF1844 domain-containing protein [Desulfovibrio sp.]
MADEYATGLRPDPGLETASQTGEAAGKTNVGDAAGDQTCLPAPTFTTFILSLASSGLVHLGEVPDPASGRTETNLALAGHTIDLLNMLREKTSQSLDEEENRLLDGLLYELRLKFVLKK